MNPHPKPLGHFIENGIAVIPTYQSGATAGSWKDPANFTTDRETIARHWKNGIRRFQFLPASVGFVCFDIDRKNGKDGLRELNRIFTEAGVALPSYLFDVYTFPARTLSPSGGLHLYFRYRGGTRYRSGDVTPGSGLEVKHTKGLLTAPGSEKDGRPYRFFGDLNAAPPLPPVVERFLTPYVEHTERSRPVHWDFDRKDHGPLSLDDIADIIDRQGEYSPGASRNRYCYEVAKFARKKDYPAAEVEIYLRGRFEAPDFDGREISGVVASAYKGGV